MIEGVRLGKWTISKKDIILGMIIFAGSLVRIIALDQNPQGLHHDEAYSAYNAYSIMKYGVDSYGYTRPVYYTVWGSGMSVLYSYLTMPFIAVMGVCTWAIRLPQAILGCLSILVVYGLGKELRGEGAGLAFAGMLAINPWHIQQSRFGLDANLTVPILLFAIYFLSRYLNGKKGSIWGTAVFMGLTLYCYALTWLLIPLILIFTLVFFRERICWDKSLLGAVMVLFVLALPLLLFLAVNFGLVPEIRTSLFSIPKLPAIRTDEMAFSLSVIKKRFLWMVAMLWAQHDDIWWISNEAVGSYYYISTPFILIGMLYHVKVFITSLIRRERLPIDFMITIWFVSAFIVGCSIDTAKYYKVNYIHIPIILYGVLGLICLCRILVRVKCIKVIMTGIYALAFIGYLYSQSIVKVDYDSYGYSIPSRTHWSGYEEAIDRAEELTRGDISIYNLNYANVMLYKKMSPYDYKDQVVYDGGSEAFRTVTSIGRYHFNTMPQEDVQTKVCVYTYDMEEELIEKGYITEPVTKCYGVAYKRNLK